jgi:hypothetical protein
LEENLKVALDSGDDESTILKVMSLLEQELSNVSSLITLKAIDSFQ